MSEDRQKIPHTDETERTIVRRELSLTDLAFEVLNEKREAMNYKDIADEVMKLKPHPISRLPRILIGMMQQDERFERIDKENWGLAKWSLPEERLEEEEKLESIDPNLPTEDIIYEMLKVFDRPATPAMLEEELRKLKTELNTPITDLLRESDRFYEVEEELWGLSIWYLDPHWSIKRVIDITLKMNNRPMPLNEIIQAVTKIKPVLGSDAEKIIHRLLNNDKRYEEVAEGRWTLNEELQFEG